MTELHDFSEKTLRQIKQWALAAVVLPIIALAGLFFVWAFGTSHWFDIAMITGATLMFSVAVCWWWWALYVMKRLLCLWAKTSENVGDVRKDIQEIRSLFRFIFSPKKTK